MPAKTIRLPTIAILTASLLSVTASRAQEAPVIPHEQTFRKTTAAGTEVRLFTYVHFAQDCTPGPLPRFQVHRQPTHGALTMRPEPMTVKVLRTGAGDCAGRTYDGMAVYYTPSAGFHGTDTFDWTETAGPHPYHDTGIVAVK